MNDRFPLLKFSIFTVVCLGFAAWIIILVGNLDFTPTRPYSAVFTNASGLLKNDGVKIAGVDVGKVSSVELIDGRSALVHFEVYDSIELEADAQVSIRWRDVLGLRFLYIEPGNGAPVRAGHQYPLAQTEEPANIGVFLNRLTPIMQAFDPEVSNLAVQALAEALVGREEEVREIIRDGASLTSAIATRDQELERLLVNAATVLDAYAQRENDLNGLLDAFVDVSGTLQQRNDTLITAVTTLDDVQDELGSLLSRNDGEIRLALDALDRATAVLSVNRDNLERVVEFTGIGIGAYHRISNLGQYFNVRGVGFSAADESIPGSSYRGAELPSPAGSSAQSSSRQSVDVLITDADPGPQAFGLGRLFGRMLDVSRGGGS